MRYSLLIILLALGNQIAAQYESEVLFETDSSVYLLLTEPTSWLVAESRAQELGGWLVTLHNEDENTAVFEAFQASESTEMEEGYFMGLRQDESLPGFYEPQGGWVWGASQGAVLWSNWDINEPNQGGNTGVENCGSVKDLNSGLGVWNDVSCSNNINKAVVEVPVFVVGCTAPPACNYDPSATFEDGSCDYASCHCLEGTVWNEELGGCVVANPSDSDFDGCVGMTDLLDLLTVFGTCNEIPWSCGDPLEYQGYNYETVQIGEQCWFAENLRAENYRSGAVIPADLDDASWATTTAGATSIFGEGGSPCHSSAPNGDACDELFAFQEYGRLYNWYAVSDERHLCPQGWGVMTVDDWNVLSNYVEGESGIFTSLALKSLVGWLELPIVGIAQDLYEYSILPGGLRKEQSADWIFEYAGNYAHFWTSDAHVDGSSFRVSMNSYGTQTLVTAVGVRNGLSVRCIKDSE